jgi:hypothetical protein
MQSKQRTVIMVTEKQHQKISTLSKQHPISMGEVGHRAIEAYNPARNSEAEIEHLAK